MNLRMARRAVLEPHSCLVVEIRRVRRADLVRVAVAFQTELTNLCANEKARIVRSVRCVADRAAFGFDGRVLENERALFVRVAFQAGRVRSTSESHLSCLKAAMRVVAIRALHCPL